MSAKGLRALLFCLAAGALSWLMMAAFVWYLIRHITAGWPYDLSGG